MHRKINSIKKLLIIIFLGLLFSGCSFFKPEKRLNLILITIDTLRADRVSVYSEKFLRTPNIDSIAKKGLIFKRAFSDVPLTLPSHTTILTGLTPLGHGVHDNMGFRVNEDIETIAEVLKREGYNTAAVVSSFPLDKRFGLSQGFDYYDDYYGTRNENEIFFPERKAESSIDIAVNWLSKNIENKFFLWLHLFDPHQPYAPPEEYRKRFKNDLYSGEVKYVDDQLGRLFSFLKEKELFHNTIIIITSDHGESLGEHGERTHGYFAYNSTLWVPLIIYFPEGKHREIGKYVSLSDIMPTILEYLKIGIPKGVQGKSLLPLIEGKSIERNYLYFESLAPNLNRGWAPLRGIIDVKKKVKYIDLPIKELYDLENDFNETKNIWGGKYRNYSLVLKKLEKDFLRRAIKIRRKTSVQELKKFESLGYLGGEAGRKKSYTKEDDLKLLLPLQNKMLDALAFYRTGEYGKALSMLSGIVKERKDFVAAWNRIVTIFKEVGMIPMAIETSKKALQYNPESYSLLLSYGSLLAEFGDKEEGLSALDKAEKIIDYDPDLWNAKGVCYWKLGEIVKAEEAFKRALSIDDNNAVVYANLGLMYLDLRFYDKAEKHLKKALSIEPNLTIALNGMGALLKRRGKKEAAVEVWKKLLKNNSRYYNGYYNLISTLIEIGNYKEAIRWYRIASKNLNFNAFSSYNRSLIELEGLRREAERFLNEEE